MMLAGVLFFFFSTLVTGPRRSVSLKLSDTRVYEPQIRARLGTSAHFGMSQEYFSSPADLLFECPPVWAPNSLAC